MRELSLGIDRWVVRNIITEGCVVIIRTSIIIIIIIICKCQDQPSADNNPNMHARRGWFLQPVLHEVH